MHVICVLARVFYSAHNGSSAASSLQQHQQHQQQQLEQATLVHTQARTSQATSTYTKTKSVKTHPAFPPTNKYTRIQYSTHIVFESSRDLPGPSRSAFEWCSGCVALTESWGGDFAPDTERKARSVRLRVRVGYPAEGREEPSRVSVFLLKQLKKEAQKQSTLN